jgi:hypothetical protein
LRPFSATLPPSARAFGEDAMKGALVRFRFVALALVTAGLVTGCRAGTSPAPSLASNPPLSISNGTTIPVTLVVNGSTVETVAPGDRQDPVTTALPPRPWTIEARSPSGRVLASLAVSATDDISNMSGRAVRADLSCGRLDVWSGPPMLGPVFSPGPPGDCR